MSGSVACPCLALAVGLVISDFVVWSGQLAGHPFGLLVLVVFPVFQIFLVLRVLRFIAVFLDGWLLSLAVGSRRGGSRLAA